MRYRPIVFGAVVLVLAGCGTAAARTASPAASPAAPASPAVPAVCAQPGGLVWKIGAQLLTAQTPADDAAIRGELAAATWPASMSAAAARMAADMSDGPAAGNRILSDDAALSNLCTER